MRVKVRWFYHAVETEGCANGGRRVDELKLPVIFDSDYNYLLLGVNESK